MNSLFQPLSVGDVIHINRNLYHHVAVVSDHFIGGEAALISISGQPGHIFEQRFSQLVQNDPWSNKGYLGSLPPYEVIQRARQMEHQPYSLGTWNCEHFVRVAHGLPAESPQVQQGIAIAVVGGMLVLLAA